MKKIAVTGGLSSGKTEVCNRYKQFGAHVVSADTIAHNILDRDTECIKELQEQFGPAIFSHGKIDRKRLAAIVFADPDALAALEALLHPRIRKELIRELGAHPFVVAEVPLLFEVGWESLFDTVIAVTAPEEACKKRFGPGYTARMRRQLPSEEKARRADIVIDNSGSLEQLQPQIEKTLDT